MKVITRLLKRAAPPYDASPDIYEAWARRRVARWRKAMLKPPGFTSPLTPPGT